MLKRFNIRGNPEESKNLCFRITVWKSNRNVSAIYPFGKGTCFISEILHHHVIGQRVKVQGYQHELPDGLNVV
jgi:hypothetical protein